MTPPQDAAEQKDGRKTTFFILIADVILGLMVLWGTNSITEKNPPTTICPNLDHFVFAYRGWLYAISIYIVIMLSAFVCKKPRTIDRFNNILFFLTTLILAWWTAHTGGLSRSLYGPGYLALFAVATIVPRYERNKFYAAVPVGALAFLMALFTPDRAREIYVFVESIVGCSIGWIILWYMSKAGSPTVSTAKMQLPEATLKN